MIFDRAKVLGEPRGRIIIRSIHGTGQCQRQEAPEPSFPSTTSFIADGETEAQQSGVSQVNPQQGIKQELWSPARQLPTHHTHLPVFWKVPPF